MRMNQNEIINGPDRIFIIEDQRTAWWAISAIQLEWEMWNPT